MADGHARCSPVQSTRDTLHAAVTVLRGLQRIAGNDAKSDNFPNLNQIELNQIELNRANQREPMRYHPHPYHHGTGHGTTPTGTPPTATVRLIAATPSNK